MPPHMLRTSSHRLVVEELADVELEGKAGPAVGDTLVKEVAVQAGARFTAHIVGRAAT